MDVEEKQEMLDVGVKKSGRDVPSSVGCVPWRLADMEVVKSFTKFVTVYMMSSLVNRCKILHLPYMA